MRIFIFLFFLITIACQKQDPKKIAGELEVLKEYGNPVGCPVNVYFFLQPDCPLSQNYTQVLHKIAENEQFKDFCFTAFFSGKLYERKEYEYFVMHYPMPYRILLDPNLRIAQGLGATVVPEVFVVDNQGKMLYQGAIDDWAVREGGKRQSAQKHYLLSALQSIARGEEPSIAKTTAVGCILQ